MPASSPREVLERFADAFAAHDLDAVMALYEPQAVLVTQPGTVVGGPAAIREALRGFLAPGSTFASRVEGTLPAGEVALVSSRWTLRGTGPDGGQVELTGQTTDVVRRQPDGSWLFVIDNPWGVAGFAASTPAGDDRPG
ncbi:MAG TPA: SgcJ/EcaC family oxidoreductase [Frankiaceae bacterium]|nr:SgcJ/EcaC family oxidoreductase [Frankiaceae bacterium]